MGTYIISRLAKTHLTTRDQSIMLLILPIMLCCSALKIKLLCSRTGIVDRLLCYSYTILHEQFTTHSRQFL